MKKNMLRKTDGMGSLSAFTLVELLVVIAIIEIGRASCRERV